MFPYTHLVWARRLHERLGVQDVAEFNLGAILPDVRYVDALSWEQTHPPMEAFWEAAQRADAQDRDFALGFIMHLGMDQWEPWFLRQARQRYRRVRFLQSRGKAFKLLMEAAELEAYPLKQIPMTQRIPDLALSLGIPEGTIRRLRELADPVLENPSLETAIPFIQKTQLARHPLIRRLSWMARLILWPPLQSFLLPEAAAVLKEMEPALEYRFLEELRPYIEIYEEAEQEEPDAALV